MDLRNVFCDCHGGEERWWDVREKGGIIMSKVFVSGCGAVLFGKERKMHVTGIEKANVLTRRQAGLTLTESLLVLAIGAAVAVLAYGGYKFATNSVTVSSQTRATTQLVASIKRVFGIANDYSTVTNQNIINARIVPEEFKISGTTIYNRWTGTVTAAVGNQAGGTPLTQFKITITQVPRDSCAEFVSGLTSAATTLWVNGTTAGTNDVKDSNGVVWPDRLATQCNNTSNTVILVSN